MREEQERERGTQGQRLPCIVRGYQQQFKKREERLTIFTEAPGSLTESKYKSRHATVELIQLSFLQKEQLPCRKEERL